jgi:hypothetical protein
MEEVVYTETKFEDRSETFVELWVVTSQANDRALSRVIVMRWVTFP